MLKKLLAIFILFLMFFTTGCGKKQEPQKVVDALQTIHSRDELIVGVRDDTKPFGYRDKEGKLVGFDIDLAKMLAQRILGDAEKVRFVVVSASDRISKLNSKEVDILVATMTITQQRLRVIDFSESYYIAGQAVMVRKKSPYTSFNELSNKQIIVVYGTTGEKSLRNIYPTAKIIGCKTYSEAFAMLKKGEADAIVADDTVLLGYAIDDNSVRLLSKRYSREPYAVAFRQGDETHSLQIEVNEYINYLLSTGKLKKLAEKYNLK